MLCSTATGICCIGILWDHRPPTFHIATSTFHNSNPLFRPHAWVGVGGGGRNRSGKKRGIACRVEVLQNIVGNVHFCSITFHVLVVPHAHPSWQDSIVLPPTPTCLAWPTRTRDSLLEPNMLGRVWGNNNSTPIRDCFCQMEYDRRCTIFP